MFPMIVDDGAGGRTVAWYDGTGQPVDAALVPAETRALAASARDALVANRAYLTLDPPTAAQVAQQVARLTRQMNVLIRHAWGWTGSDADEDVFVPPAPLPVGTENPPPPGSGA